MAAGGAVLQLAVQIVDELVHQSPALVHGGLAEQHGAQLGVSGAGLGRVGEGDLTLQGRVSQAFPGGGNIGLVDEGLVIDEAHGQGGLTDPQIVGILVSVGDDIVMGAHNRLEQIGVAGQSVGAAAPQHIGLGILSLSSDSLDALAGGDIDELHIDVGVCFPEHGDAGLQRSGIVGGVDDQVAGVIGGSFLGGFSGSSGCLGCSGCSRSSGSFGGSGLSSTAAAGQHQQAQGSSQNTAQQFHRLFHDTFLPFLVSLICFE